MLSATTVNVSRFSRFKRVLLGALMTLLIGCSQFESPPGLSQSVPDVGQVGARDVKVDVLYRFKGGDDGRAPGMIALAPSGAIFGITRSGGGAGCRATYVSGCGAVFELTPSTTGYGEQILHRFSQHDDGVFPVGLTLKDGQLYGATALTWPDGCGSIFKIAPIGAQYVFNTVYAFDGLGGSGCAPRSPPVVGKDGAIYGTTVGGGTHDLGTVFKLAPASTGYAETVLYSFAGGSDGKWPSGTVTFDPTGDIYGTTMAGGRAGCNGTGCGIAYRLHLTASGYVEDVLHRFTGAEGSPWDGVTMSNDGALYGVTGGGACGLAFQLATNASDSYRVIHRFVGSDGCDPDGVIVDARRDIFGTTEFGGPKRTKRCPIGCGTVFELMPSSSGYRAVVLHSFDGFDGEQPVSGVVADDGRLYATADEGGTGCPRGYGGGGCGTVFSLPLQVFQRQAL